jgi:2,3-bisphosphoglycerate-dependent phosphoglycerate mutase
VHDPRYADIPPTELPRTEALQDTLARVLPYWLETVAPAVRAGRRVLIAAHGNSLRALVKHLDRLSDEEIIELNIPTGIPLVYELDEALNPVRHFYLGEPEAVEAAQRAVAGEARGFR